MEKKQPRCNICRALLNPKIPNQEIGFIRGDRIVDRFRVCVACYNKYFLKIKEDTMDEAYQPEKEYPMHVSSVGYMLKSKK